MNGTQNQNFWKCSSTKQISCDGKINFCTNKTQKGGFFDVIQLANLHTQ